MAPRANLQREPDRCSRDLLGTTGAGPRWVYRLGYLSPCQEVQGRGPLRFASSSQKQAALDGIFFFQAEDGIRDCLLSRGLGDVYKRQRDGCTSCRWKLSSGSLLGLKGGELGIRGPVLLPVENEPQSFQRTA